MRFYTNVPAAYCGIDLHARTMDCLSRKPRRWRAWRSWGQGLTAVEYLLSSILSSSHFPHFCSQWRCWPPFIGG